MKTYFEVHYKLPNVVTEYSNINFIYTYRGKLMRQYCTVKKAVAKLKKEHPDAYDIDIAEYDEGGRIDYGTYNLAEELL